MSIFQRITTGRVKKPLFCLIYSGPGVGKTDMGASFPDPLFFDFEESSHNIVVNRIDNLIDFDEVMEGLVEIHEEKVGTLDFKSIIFDTIDALERLMHNSIAKDNDKKSIDHIGWQKGFDYAINLWADFISICRQIRDKHGIHFLFLAHDDRKTRTDVEKEESYTKNTINIHKKAVSFIFGSCEMVLYAKKEVKFKKDSEGNTFAVDSEKRVLCTTLSAHHDAKNRIGLPPIMPMPVKNGFNVLYNAYLREFDRPPEEIQALCVELLPQIKDENKRKETGDYVEKHKADIAILRFCLNRIREIIGEQ